MPINRYEDEGIARYWNSKYDDDYHPYLHGRQKSTRTNLRFETA